MKIVIPIGTHLEKEHIVSTQDTALQYGSGSAEVFATPAMIAFMEQTAYKSIQQYLPEGCSSVGISINVQHKKATLPGKKVSCRSEVINIEGKKITFTIVVNEGYVEIGTAEHVRYIINSEEFMARLA